MVDATQLQDQLVQSRVHRERDEFIASIPKHQVLALASSHRNATPCDFFDEPKRGSYNICYFLRFPEDVKWVVRIPLVPCLAFGSRSKLESEIATMQYATLASHSHLSVVPLSYSCCNANRRFSPRADLSPRKRPSPSPS